MKLLHYFLKQKSLENSDGDGTERFRNTDIWWLCVGVSNTSPCWVSGPGPGYQQRPYTELTLSF